MPDDLPPYQMETERLRLVPLDATRADELAALYADPEVARYIGADALDAAGTRAQVERFEAVWREHCYGQSALLDRGTGRLVGRAGLHPWPGWGELELGYALVRDRWGTGLAREACGAWLDWAFAHLPHDHLIAVIQPGNAASIGLAERLGFGFDRDDVTPSGVEVAIYRLER
ncbi:MAG TPA: GNAT family N-acetyltransferase [Nocardioides sp.]|nr:GNAT family N-acetyltransferase [Nocardioides sp.]